MKKRISTLIVLVIVLSAVSGPVLDTKVANCSTSLRAEWNKMYSGSTGPRGVRCVIRTSDGGYLIAGETGYDKNEYYHFLLVRTDSEGNMLWNRTYGGPTFDDAVSVVQTADGFTVLGSTMSFGAGEWDFWLVKIDLSGNMQWNHTYGTPKTETAHCLIQTRDGGYLMAGFTRSYTTGYGAAWLIKTDPEGTAQWNKTYGDVYDEDAFAVIQTNDLGYAFLGLGVPEGGWLPKDANFLVAKTDQNGVEEWTRQFRGPTYSDEGRILQTSDGGYVIVSRKEVAGRTPEDPSRTDGDIWVARLDKQGQLDWNMTYDEMNNGRPGDEEGEDIIENNAGGFVILGSTLPFWSSSQNFSSVLIIKTDDLGNVLWNKTYSEPYNIEPRSIFETSDGGYVIGGTENGLFCLMKLFLMENPQMGIVVLSPQNNTYSTSNISLDFTLNESAVWIGYSLDLQDNVTILGNTTLSPLSEGSHSVVVYARDAFGSTGTSNTIYFVIQQGAPFPFWIVAVIAMASIAVAFIVYLARTRKRTMSSSVEGHDLERLTETRVLAKNRLLVRFGACCDRIPFFWIQ